MPIPSLSTSTFSAFAAGGKTDLLHSRAQPLGQARGGFNEIWKPFGEDFAGTVGVASKELAHREHQANGTANARQIPGMAEVKNCGWQRKASHIAGRANWRGVR